MAQLEVKKSKKWPLWKTVMVIPAWCTVFFAIAIIVTHSWGRRVVGSIWIVCGLMIVPALIGGGIILLVTPKKPKSEGGNADAEEKDHRTRWTWWRCILAGVGFLIMLLGLVTSIPLGICSIGG